MTQNPPPNFQIFAKLMEMTTSPHDAEALVAIRKANALLARTNQTWHDLLSAKVTMMPGSPFDSIPDPFAKPEAAKPKPKPGPRHDKTSDPEIDDWFDDLLHGSRRVTTGFRTFVEDVHQWWQDKGFLTDAQYQTIKKAATK